MSGFLGVSTPLSSPLIRPLIEAEYYISTKLAPAESIPLLGMIPSALKAVIALAKVVLGIAIVLIGAPFFFLSHLLCEKVECLTTLNQNLYGAGLFLATSGIAQFFERLRNIETLGLHYYHYPPRA